MKKIIGRFPSWMTNKYLLSAAVFLVWMLFFDQQDFITTHFRQTAELKKLTESRIFYENEIQHTAQQLEELRSNPELVEKLAREKYRMKKSNEDLFIIP